MSIAMKQMRESGKRARHDIGDSNRAKYSSRICRHFLHSALFFRSKSIACYLAMSDEVDTSMIIERAWSAKKRVFVPQIENHMHMRFMEITRNTRLERNQFGIWEPHSGKAISPEKLDVVVTPLVVFDQSRNRIGTGGGYYDRCFSFLKQNRKWQRPKLAGVAFDCQEVEKISPNPWDIRLYRVFTETR
jgi:5-formyltetrahydrofolate cyclo-ligase